MTSHGRTLIIVAVVSLLGIAALGFMAQRYGDMAARRAKAGSLRARAAAPGSEDPERELGAFLAVRREVKLAVGRNRAALDVLLESGSDASKEAPGPGRRALEEVLRTRARALESAGLAPARYEELRKAYRRWKKNEPDLDPALRARLEARRWELQSVDLGRYELLEF